MTDTQRAALRLAVLIKDVLTASGVTPGELRQLRALRELRQAVEARPALRGMAS